MVSFSTLSPDHDTPLSQIQLSPIKKKRSQYRKTNTPNPKTGILLSKYLGVNNLNVDSNLKSPNKLHRIARFGPGEDLVGLPFRQNQSATNLHLTPLGGRVTASEQKYEKLTKYNRNPTRKYNVNREDSQKHVLNDHIPKFKLFAPPIFAENPMPPSPKGEILNHCRIHPRSNDNNQTYVSRSKATVLSCMKKHENQKSAKREYIQNCAHTVKLPHLNGLHNDFSIEGKKIITLGDIIEAKNHQIPLELIMDNLTI